MADINTGRLTPNAGTQRTGQLVELHGSIHELVCGSCGATVSATPAMVAALRAEEHLPCACGAPQGLRFKVMLYDDAEGG